MKIHGDVSILPTKIGQEITIKNDTDIPVHVNAPSNEILKMKYTARNLEDIAKMFDSRAADESRKMNSLAVSQKAKLDYKARMQTWTAAASMIRLTTLNDFQNIVDAKAIFK